MVATAYKTIEYYAQKQINGNGENYFFQRPQ